MSKLSVDAAVFIPGQGNMPAHQPEMAQCLPQYITTCYPFVQGDPGIASKTVPPPPNQLSDGQTVYHAVQMTSQTPITSLHFPPAVFPVQNLFPPPARQNLNAPPYGVGQEGGASKSSKDNYRGQSFERFPRPERGPRSGGAPYGTRPPRPGKPRQEAPLRRAKPLNGAVQQLTPPRNLCPDPGAESTSPGNPPSYFHGNDAVEMTTPLCDGFSQTDTPFNPDHLHTLRNDDDDKHVVMVTTGHRVVAVATQTFRATIDDPGTSAYNQRLSYASVTRAPPPPPPAPAQQPISAPESTQEAESSENQPMKKRRKRTRKKKNKEDSMEERAQSPEQIVLAAADLRFEDENEFPGLLENTQNVFNVYASQPLMPYSTVLTGRPPNTPWNAWTNHQAVHAASHYVQPIDINADDHVTKMNQSGMRSGSGQNSNASSTRSLDKAGKENKATRKRRKRRELANEAADKELLEISLEQQVLKQIGLKAKAKPAKPAPAPQAQRKSKEPVALNIAEMISALENQQIGAEEPKPPKPKLNKEKTVVVETKTYSIANALDANPSAKRGKERENPKAKKPSTLKKVILKEREDRRRMRWMDDTNLGTMTQFEGVDEDEDGKMQEPTKSGELSPVSQTSPISMSPISPGGSPLSSEVNSPVQPGFVKSAAAMSIHSRRFREYCNQILDKEIDECCISLLQDLVRFQDRIYHKEPNKVKSKRRFVLGLREVTKHLKLRKIKCVVISPNLERIQSKGGLDEALNVIIGMCQEQDVPFVFALGRRALGRACAKLVPVSVVGIFNYDGSEENYRKLIDLTEQAREQYNKMIKELELECEEASQKPTPQPTQVYAHMGHSRTPSGCSGISFASSMMSEPISELGRDEVTKLQVPEKNEYFRRAHLSHSRNSSLGKVSIVESITEADESHYEADTEELPDSAVQRRHSALLEDDDVDTIEDLPAQQTQDQMSSSSRTVSITTLTTPLATATSSGTEDVGLVSHRLKVIDQERIESWVEKAASSIQQLRLEEDSSEQSASTAES